MRSVEAGGRTVEEAVSDALAKLGAERRHADVEVLQQPSRGLLGVLGQREARVRVTERRSKADFAREFVSDVARRLGLDVSVEVRETEEQVELLVAGPSVGLLIGRRGQTMNALQYLVNVAAARVSRERKAVIVDVGGYRQRRAEMVSRLAHRAAGRVRKSGRRVPLEPMSAWERRVVHLALRDEGGVVTESEGREPQRRVVVRPAGGIEQTGS